ncbi:MULTISPECIES: AMP-binding protein [unclassified Roseitalea]|uniref:AMP-binding protein n=1 Tax=unclassified Roseitalea TaxID=2639107 RepID=UPI00273D98ED|nr:MULTISPECIES: AMP-binding protein [unclassified Roseitalea]
MITQSQLIEAGTVFGLLERQAQIHGDRDLLVLPRAVQDHWGHDRDRLRYAEGLARSRALSAAYAAAGLGTGHRVALLLENRPEHFIHWLALNALGVSVVPVNPDYREDELDYLLGHSEAVLLVRLAERAGQVDAVAARRSLPVIAPDEAPPQIAAPANEDPPGPQTECALVYTSGTTGRPKGCMLSNRYFLNWSWWYAAQGGPIALRPGAERLLTPLPTFHVNAMGHSFMGMLGSGGAQIIMDRFHPRQWWQTAIETGATCFHYLGVMPAILLELPESVADRGHGMRFGLGGGVHPDHHARFEARFGVPLLEGWAMTETGGAGSMCDTGEGAQGRHIGARCIGRPDRPGPALECRLVDDDGRPVARGEPGELQLRAPGDDPRLGFFSGYLKDAAATEDAWRDGWLHTGDIMRQGPDGALFFVDRKKNIIRRSGENIAAAEVEAVIAPLDGVAQVAVTAAIDPLREEEVMAVIVAMEGADRAELADRVFDACAGHLAYYKAPGFVVFTDRLPTTSTQKVQKAALREWAQDPLSAPGCIDLRARKQALRKARR